MKEFRMQPSKKNRYIDMPLQYLLIKEYKEICNANHGILVSSDTEIDYTFSSIKSCIYKFLENRCNSGGCYGY